MNGENQDVFRRSVELYVDSIVSNEIPLPVDQHACAKCGASHTSWD
jgi:hypothetical protein